MYSNTCFFYYNLDTQTGAKYIGVLTPVLLSTLRLLRLNRFAVDLFWLTLVIVTTSSKYIWYWRYCFSFLKKEKKKRYCFSWIGFLNLAGCIWFDLQLLCPIQPEMRLEVLGRKCCKLLLAKHASGFRKLEGHDANSIRMSGIEFPVYFCVTPKLYKLG